MAIRLDPDPGTPLVEALAALLEAEGLLLERGAVYSAAWRTTALREDVSRARVAVRRDSVERSYVAAPWPRRMRGATRA